MAWCVTVPSYVMKRLKSSLAAARSGEPQVQAAMENFKTPQGFAVFLAFGLVFLFVLFVVQ